jgi:hypothetical protein
MNDGPCLVKSIYGCEFSGRVVNWWRAAVLNEANEGFP